MRRIFYSLLITISTIFGAAASVHPEPPSAWEYAPEELSDIVPAYVYLELDYIPARVPQLEGFYLLVEIDIASDPLIAHIVCIPENAYTRFLRERQFPTGLKTGKMYRVEIRKYQKAGDKEKLAATMAKYQDLIDQVGYFNKIMDEIADYKRKEFYGLQNRLYRKFAPGLQVNSADTIMPEDVLKTPANPMWEQINHLKLHADAVDDEHPAYQKIQGFIRDYAIKKAQAKADEVCNQIKSRVGWAITLIDLGFTARAVIAARNRSLFEAFKPRPSMLDDEMAGAAIFNRQLVTSQLDDGVYLYAVDDAGRMWVGDPTKFTHNALVPKGASVKVAGELQIKGGKALANPRSGHFLQGAQALSKAEMAAWHKAMKQLLKDAGFKKVTTTESLTPLGF